MNAQLKAILETAVDQFAAKIVAEVMAERKLGEKDFKNSLRSQCVLARRIAMKRLRAEGLRIIDVARVLEMNEGGIRYHLNPRRAAHHNAMRMKAYHEARA